MSRKELVDAYWKSRRSIEDGDLERSVDSLKEYISLLPDEIAHEPEYWLARQYLKMKNADEALEAGKRYLVGCNYPHAAKSAKELSLLFGGEGYDVHSFSLIRLSKKYTKLQKEIRSEDNESV